MQSHPGFALTQYRHVDKLIAMNAETPKRDGKGRHKTRQIVGFSLTPEFATEIKTEATRRNLSLQELLREMWTAYKAQ